MSTTSSIRFDDGVKEKASIIAEELGLTFNAVMNMMAKRFVAERGFPYDVKLPAKKDIETMTVFDIEDAARKAVANRSNGPIFDYVAYLDPVTNTLVKRYENGRVERV